MKEGEGISERGGWGRRGRELFNGINIDVGS